MRRARTTGTLLLWLAAPISAAFGVASCQAPPAERAPAAPSASQRVAASESADCDAAPARRAKVRKLLAEGKLDRSLRTLADVNRLCPASAGESRAEEMLALAEIGRHGEARALARAVLAEPGAAKPAREAAERALAVVKEREGLAANPAWGDELLEAGRAAGRAGAPVEAQRLYDRAAVALERQLSAKLELEAPNGLSEANFALRALSWSGAGDRLALGRGNEVVIVGARTLEHQARLLGHRETVLATAFSPDGALVASGSQDQSLKLWRADTGRLLRSLEAAGEVASIAFGAAGDTVAAGASDGAVRLWRAADGALLRVLGSDPPRVAAIALARSGGLLAAAKGNQVQLWRTDTGEKLSALAAHAASVDSVALSADGSVLATSSRDGTARLWRTSDGHQLRSFRGAGFWPTAVSLSPDASLLAVVSSQALKLFRVKDGKLLQAVEDMSGASIVFSPDGSELAATSASTLSVFGAADGHLVRSLAPRAGPVTALDFSDPARLLGAASGDAFWLWDYRSGGLRRRQAALPHALSFSHDGRLLALGTTTQVSLVEVAGGERTLWSQAHAGLSAVAVSPDASLVASASFDSVSLWRARDGQLVRRLVNREDGIVLDTAVRFSPDGVSLAAAAGALAKVWRVADGSFLGAVTLRGTSDTVTALCFTSDPGHLALGSSYQGAELREVQGGGLLRTFTAPSGIAALAASPDGQLLGAAGLGFAGVWRVADGSLVSSWPASAFSGAAALASDGWFATGDQNGDVHLHRLGSPRPMLHVRWLKGANAGFAWTESGEFDFIGNDKQAAEAALRCRVGPRYFPLELCRERFLEPGLVARVLGGH